VFGNDSDDRRLVERVTAGDRCALRTLYTAYFPRLAAFLSNLTTAAVEDVINDILLDIWRLGGNLRRTESIHVWIMQLALSHARFHPSTFSSRPATTGKAALLANLSFEEKAIIHLVYTGHTRREVAQILGTCEAGMDRLLTDARLACARNDHFTLQRPAGVQSVAGAVMGRELS
jgi:DNA-directed RNA polymerase specialized sigma24 family protein